MGKEAIHTLFLEAASKYRDNIVFHYFDKTWKEVIYSELCESTKGIASYLIKKGIKKGDKIAIISENRPEWCASYLAISISGGIAVPIDAQLGPAEIRNLLSDSESKIVFFSSKTQENVTKALHDLVTHYSLHIILINFDSPEFKNICNVAGVTEYPDVSDKDIASLIYTSGTTGQPKGVELTHKNLCSDAQAIIEAGIVTHKDNMLSVLPLHHTYPFMCTFLVPVILGASITYPSGLKGPEIMEAIQSNEVTALVGVPRLLEFFRDGIKNKMRNLPGPLSGILIFILKLCGILREKTGINLGKLIFRSAHRHFGRKFRFLTSGGAKLDPDVMKDLEAIGFIVLEGYGLTETSPVVTFSPIKRRKAGSAGKPLPSAMIKIADRTTGEPLGVMKEGEIAIKGPMVMNGYYKHQDFTGQVMRDEWFFTGDLGYMDDDGYLFITGRVKDVIILSSGESIYPEDVEREYLKVPLIKEICVIGIEEKGIVDSLHGVIVPDIEYAKKEQIGNFMESLRWEINNVALHMPQYLRIKGFTLCLKPLPKTPLGKFKRYMVKDLIKTKGEELRARGEDKDLISDETGRMVIECIKPLLRELFPIQRNDNLELDLGLDSLARIELIVSLENTFGIKLPDSFAPEIQTVEDIVKRIKEYKTQEEKEIERLPKWKGILQEEPSIEDRKKVGLHHTLLQRVMVIFILMLNRVILKIFFQLKVKGIEHLPRKGPYIIASNHTSYIDGFAVIATLPLKSFWDLYSIGLQVYFTGRLSFFAKLAHVIPIDREKYLQKALQIAAFILRKGKTLLIFPEGGRSYDGQVMEFKKGVGILAFELRVPIIPAYIEGSFEALPRGRKWPKFKEIKIIFGKPFSPSDLDMSKIGGIDEYQYFVNELREKVKMLKD